MVEVDGSAGVRPLKMFVYLSVVESCLLDDVGISSSSASSGINIKYGHCNLSAWIQNSWELYLVSSPLMDLAWQDVFHNPQP